MYGTIENCLVCRRKTYGSIFCSLKHNNEYQNNKTRFSKKKLIKEKKEDRKKELTEIKESIKELISGKKKSRGKSNNWEIPAP